uniref:Brix domain-containing protein n=1 Tax=Oryza rufipogon TaxID=4529 RepID=A0A0E0MRB8_ORYRU
MDGGGGGDPGGWVGEAKADATRAANKRRAPSPAGGGGVEAKMRRKDAMGSSVSGSRSGGGGGRRLRHGRGRRARAFRRKLEEENKNSNNIPRASNVVIAYTPNLIRRYGTLLRNISFLLPYDGQGKAYACPSDKINVFLKWSRCNFCLFFEMMICHMFNTLKEIHISFLINPAFLDESMEVKVTNPLLSFSSNFVEDETWALVKEMLMMMFSPVQEDERAASDLYVFTKSRDSVYFRIFKITSIPAGESENSLVLDEVGLNFCLKLLDVHGAFVGSDCDQALDGLQSQNGLDLSHFEGFCLTLEEFLERNSFLKIKHIVGSRNDEECNFVRNIAKAIIRSMLSHLVNLFSLGKCLRMGTDLLSRRKILLKVSDVKFFQLEVIAYEEDEAINNVLQVVELVKSCFVGEMIPADLQGDLHDLEENPLKRLESVIDSSSLMSAKEKKGLLVNLHTEYKTNISPAISEDDRDSLFKHIPYLDCWMNRTEDNEYLKLVANLDSKKVALKVNKVGTDKRKPSKNGILQFDFMRNSDVHIPEKALKDGITPFRLSWTDYISTSRYPTYLRAIQKSLEPYMKSRKKLK